MKHIIISFDIEEVTSLGTLKTDEKIKEIFKKEIKEHFFPAVLEKLKVNVSKSIINEDFEKELK